MTLHGPLDTPLLELEDHPLPSDNKLDPLDVAVDGGSVEEGDVDTRVTAELVLVRVGRWVWFKNPWFKQNVARSNGVELGVITGEVKTACALVFGRAGVADGEAKDGGQGLEQLGSVEGADGLLELGADVAGHGRLADLIRYEKLLALLGNGKTVFTGEGVRLDANSDEEGGDGLSDETDARDVRDRPLHPLGPEDIVNPRSEVILPDRLRGVVADGLILLAREVRLREGGRLPSIGASASHEDLLRVQPVIVPGLRPDQRQGGEKKRWCSEESPVRR